MPAQHTRPSKHLSAIALVFGFVILSTSVFAQASAGTGTQGASEYIRVTTFKQRGTDVLGGSAEGTVAAPFAETLQAVEDYGRYSQFMPYCHVSRVLSRRGPNALVYVQTRVLRNTATFWAELKIVEKRLSNGDIVVDARPVQGNLQQASARWILTPLAGGLKTRVIFQLLVDPNLPLPDEFLSTQNQNASRRAIEALRQHMRVRAAGKR